MANGQSLLLSATELKAMTKWPDALIYEFLSLQSSVQEITQTINIVVQEVTQNIVNQMLVQIDSLSSVVINNAEEASENSASIGALKSGLNSLQASMSQLAEQQAEALSLSAQLQAFLSRTASQVQDLQQQTPETLLAPQVAALQKRIENIEQMVA